MKAKNWKTLLSRYLPERILSLLADVDASAPLEELRLRAGKPLQLCFGGYERLIYAAGGQPACFAADCAAIVARLCEQSVYAWEEELKHGFVTLEGGVRAGLAGRSVLADGQLHHLSDVTGICFRIARACEGVAEPLCDCLTRADGGLYSTLIVSPPGCGKTTLLRDLARIASYGYGRLRPMRVGIVDTRFELAGCVRGEAQFDIGPRTDVQSGGAKTDGIRQFIRCMSPEVLITDEIGDADDAVAVAEAAAAGVCVAASAHAGTLRHLACRPALERLLSDRLFERFVLLGRSRGVGTVELVCDGNGKKLNLEGIRWQNQLRS